MKRYRFLFLVLVCCQIVQAQSGKALMLDGSGSYMSVADHDELDIQAGESFSLTCWAKTASNSNFYRIVSKRGNTGASSPGFELISKTGTGEFGINLRSVSGANAGPPFGNTSITDGDWHHLAMVVDAASGMAKIYVDGALEKNSTSAAIGMEHFDNALNLHLGASLAPDFFWNGSLDDVRIWSKALSDAEVLNDASDSITGSEPNLIAAWDFEDVQNQTVPSLGGQHPGTLHGNALCLDPNSTNMTLLETARYHPDLPTGRGAQNERLVSVNFKTIGAGNPLTIGDLKFAIDPQANPAALQTARLYFNGTATRLNLSTAQLLGEAQVVAGQISFSISKNLSEGNNVFWLCADIAPGAEEGALVGAQLVFFKQNGAEIVPVNPPNTPLRPVLLEHRLLFSGGDFGSSAYRIPAVAAHDGHLVVAADARINNNGDLPNNIDIVARHSNDGGQTWSAPVTVADFGNSGASDPALVFDKNSGDLLCLFASHNGLFSSTPSNKIRFQVARSTDFGATWSAPQEFSDQIYLPGWYAAWVASGSAHQMPSGRIVAAVGARTSSGNTISNFMIYSDDGGLSWQTSPGQASPLGDEAKIVTLDDGRLYMSIRSPGQRKVTFSSDNGATWSAPVPEPELVEPAVNGDLIRYTSEKDGFDKSRLLFSIASHPTQRRNLMVFVSYDEGETWGTKRVICPGPSAYSALTSLDDGTIGLFYENGEYENYQLNFARFSLDWLTGGTDSWMPPLGTKDADLDDAVFSVSPNPAGSALEIRLDLPENKLVSLDAFDATGSFVQAILPPEELSGEQRFAWHTSGFAAGVYFVRLRCGQRVAVRLVIVY
jgi:BNR repeat-like domain/Concanavalin A-like lectin/glucanases superfamily